MCALCAFVCITLEVMILNVLRKNYGNFLLNYGEPDDCWLLGERVKWDEKLKQQINFSKEQRDLTYCDMLGYSRLIFIYIYIHRCEMRTGKLDKISIFFFLSIFFASAVGYCALCALTCVRNFLLIVNYHFTIFHKLASNSKCNSHIPPFIARSNQAMPME